MISPQRSNGLLLSLATAVCVAALYAKQPQAFHLPQFYAEEGKLFFADAFNEGWRSLFYTANGYFHLWPRLLANLTLSLGVHYGSIPAVFVYICLPIYFLLWLLIFTRLSLPPSAKMFAVLATVLLPLGNEIFMNQTNVQWVMALLPIVLFCGKQPDGLAGQAVDYVILAFCVFTGPYVLFFFPIFAVAAILERQLKPRAIFLAICGIAFVACLAALVHFGTVDRVRGETRATWYGYVQLAFRQYYYPLLSIWVDRVPPWIVIAGAVLLPPALLWHGRNLLRSRDRFALISFIAGLSLFVATMASYGRRPALLSPFINAIRNFYLPMVLMLWSVIATARFDRKRVIAWSAASIWCAAQIPLIDEPRVMPDQRWEKYAERLYTQDYETVTIPITPLTWGMKLKKRQ